MTSDSIYLPTLLKYRGLFIPAPGSWRRLAHLQILEFRPEPVTRFPQGVPGALITHLIGKKDMAVVPALDYLVWMTRQDNTRLIHRDAPVAACNRRAAAREADASAKVCRQL